MAASCRRMACDERNRPRSNISTTSGDQTRRTIEPMLYPHGRRRKSFTGNGGCQNSRPSQKRAQRKEGPVSSVFHSSQQSRGVVKYAQNGPKTRKIVTDGT